VRILYLDCPSGASGDMLVGALSDLGVSRTAIKAAIASLRLPALQVGFGHADRGGIRAARFRVEAASAQPHRGLPQILRILKRGRLSPRVRATATAVFRRLCAVEAAIHRVPVARVHLHEVGALDAIADVVAAAFCLDSLAPDRIVVSPLPLGGGTVTCEHGVLPVPAPATLELLRGRPVYGGPVLAEMVTPTGAAILATVADDFGPMPPMRPERTGMGAGSRDHAEIPNVLRAVLGEADPLAASRDTVAVLQANLDDLNPQIAGHLLDELLTAGALEVFFTPAQMKKNRPGLLLTVLAREPEAERMARKIFAETTTIGVRWQRAHRWELPRREERVRTRWGNVRVKIAELDGEELQAAPEYEDCRALARRARVPLRQVLLDAARVAAARRRGKR
jgi:uncharacterized protein (TIGR00299 family) protein